VSIRFRALLVPFSILGFAVSALAGPLTGRVVDPDGRAVPGATVLLVRGNTVLGTTVTDAAGAFTLEGPNEGRAEIRVAVDGLRARPVPIAGEAAARDIGEIALAVSAVSESVVVTASQVEVPLSTTSSSVTVLTGDELLARQTESLQDALRLVPGLAVAESGGRGAVASVFPRGGESDYSLVLIDGVPANTFGGGFDFAHVPIVNVERIEIVRGPQSALYGSNAIGSVIRVITKRGGPPAALASLEGGSFDTTRATAATAGGLGSWQWGASAERLASDGMNGERTAAGETVVNDDYERHAFSAGGGWTRTDGTGIRANLHYINDERGAPGPFGSDPAGLFSGIDAVSRGSNDRWFSSISGATASGRRVRAQGQLTHGRVEGVFVSPFGDSESWSHRTTARVQTDITVMPALDSSIGAELQRESSGSTFITAADFREVPVERSLAGFFGEARWSRDGRIFVTGGVRVERITRNALEGNPDAFAPRPDFADETIVSANPKIAAAWFLRSSDGEYTKVRGSAGTGIRPPDGFEIAFTDNPGLKPERSRSVDFGVDQAFAGGRALVEATAFFSEYDDLIIAVGSFSQSSRFRTDNISNARSRGLELAGSGRMRVAVGVPLELHLRIAYTLLNTEILAVDLGSGAPSPFVIGDPLLRRPKHQFAADLLVEAGSMSAFLQGGGRNRALDVEPSTGTFGGLFYSAGYSVWNAGLSWKLIDQVQLFGRVNNIFGREYEEVLGFPALPRGVLAGVRVAAGR
jgi:outer membrane cobalamin receptor